MNDPRWLDGTRDPVEAELRRALDDAAQREADEVALRRVWGKVQYVETEGRRPRWFWFVGGVVSSAMLASALVLGVWTKSTGDDKVNALVAGSAVIEAPAGEKVAAATPPAVVPAPEKSAAEIPDEDELESGPRLVRTAAGETMRVALAGGIQADLGARSVLNVMGKERPALEGGVVGFKVPRQPPGKTFSVDAGPYRVVVVGTKFRLRHQGRRVTVDVDEGVVEIWRGRRLARLTAGESWAGPARESRPSRVPAAASRGNAVAIAAPAMTSTTSSKPGTPTADAPIEWPSLVSAPATPPAPAVVTLPVAPTAPPPAATQTPSEARAALAAGDFHRALELYRGIRARGGPAAENAEYEIGMILRDRLKRPNKAIAIWRRYRAEHPDGLLRVEADVSIIETLVSSGENEAALAETQDFLRRHPGSERRAEIAAVAGDLYRTSNECGRAVNAYDVALTSSRTRKISDAATFHRAVCLTALNKEEGRAGLRVYLRDFANGQYRDHATRLLQGIDRGSP